MSYGSKQLTTLFTFNIIIKKFTAALFFPVRKLLSLFMTSRDFILQNMRLMKNSFTSAISVIHIIVYCVYELLTFCCDLK